MLLMKRNFYWNSGCSVIKSGWMDTNVDYYLCGGEFEQFIDVPECIKKIQIILSTNRLSKHSLCITGRNQYNTWGMTDVFLSIDGEDCLFDTDVLDLLSGYLQKHDNVYATVYYWK